MGLLSKLKSFLGMGESDRSAGSGVDVTVEREADDAADETAEADAAAAETDAAASTESLVDEEHTDDSTRAAEPGEATVGDGDESAVADDDAADTAESTDVDAEVDDAADAEPEAEADDGGGESVSVVKGIGPAYAERLEAAGVETVADLRAADADDIADRTDLSAKRVGRWIENARNRD